MWHFADVAFPRESLHVERAGLQIVIVLGVLVNIGGWQGQLCAFVLTTTERL